MDDVIFMLAIAALSGMVIDVITRIKTKDTEPSVLTELVGYITLLLVVLCVINGFLN